MTKYKITVSKVSSRTVEMPHMRPSFQELKNEEVLFSAEMSADTTVTMLSMLNHRKDEEVKAEKA